MKSRNSDNYRHTVTKDGGFSPHLSCAISKRLISYCEQQNINKTKFVEKCISDRLDVLEREALNNMTKEMLIEILLTRKDN